jgi:hypothetical protein
MTVITLIRLGNHQEINASPIKEDMTKWEFWGRTQEGEEIKLFYFDEDAPAPVGYEEVKFEGVPIFPVTLFKRST